MAVQAETARPAANKPVIEVRGLKMHFPIRKGLLKRIAGYVYAVDGVDFHINQGETLGLVGESGCGKSTVGRMLLKLYEPTGGEIRFEGRDILALDDKELNRIRQRIQIIFQDPYSSLNPRLRVKEIVGEAYRVHSGDKDWANKVREVLGKVGLQPDHMSRYPHEFSGGQRQRIGIARALSLSPQLIIADEAVSALDVSIQAQVINLLDSLKAEFGFSFLFISHDLSVVEHIADRVAVMYLGKIVEVATDRSLYQTPLHPYTEALIAAVPRAEAGGRARRKTIIRGDVPSPVNPPSGCRFHTRCPKAMDHCRVVEPAMVEARPNHWVACHLHGPMQNG
jgi:oligopeptide/dipeptide ABC transporter ATP-binding protein